MTDLSEFRPTSTDEFLDTMEAEIGAELIEVWNTAKSRLSRNLKVLGETTMRAAAAYTEGQLTEADIDAIISQQEQLFNATLNAMEGVPYVAAQSVLDTIFKVAGWAIYNFTGVNIFPARVKPG